MLLVVNQLVELSPWVWALLLAAAGLGALGLYLADRSDWAMLLTAYVLLAIALLIALDDDDPMLVGHDHESRLDALVFSGYRLPIDRVMVAGEWRVRGGEVLGADLELMRTRVHEQATRLWSR